MLVDTVREFVERDVKPTVREVEHANEYPEAWIEQMKRIGIFGLAVPEEYGGTPVSTRCYVLVTQELARGWMSLAGAMGGHTVVAKLLSLFGTDEQKRRYLPADGHRRDARDHGAHRARRWFGPAGHDDDRPPRRRRPGDQRRQDVDHQRAALGSDRPAVQDRSRARRRSTGASRSCSPSTATA